MGDAENGPSKKRAAGRELSRDNPGLDDEDTPEDVTGTFKRASDEVLAARRFVKVRRRESTADSTPNPFAGICLIAPNESSAKPAEPTAAVQSSSVKTDAAGGKGSEDAMKDARINKEEEKKQAESKMNEVVDESNADNDNSGTGQTDTVTVVMGKKEIEDKVVIMGNETKDEISEEKEPANNACDGKAVKSKTDKDGDIVENETEDSKDSEKQTEVKSSDGATLRSFQQMSSTQNAFTGLAGTGFSSSTFSFGSFSNEGSTLGVASSSIVGIKMDKPLGLGLSTNGNSSMMSKGDGAGFPTMQEVSVETGEENEKTVFAADSVLFEFVDKGWKERGKGELKVNVTTTGSETARLLMRAKGNYRLILNARLYADMKLANMEKRGITFACINSASERKDDLCTFALKFKDASVVEDFRAAVMEHKNLAAAVLKTPENSPKASDV